MGLLGYILPYTGEEEKKRILEVIRQQNEFEHLSYGRLLKRRPKYLAQYTHVILCVQRYTHWFRDHNIYSLCYEDCNKRMFSAESTWETVDFDGKVYKQNKKTKKMEVVADYKWKNEEEDNYDLNREDAEEWIQKQREEYALGQMTIWKKEKLESIPGWVWKTPEQERKEWLAERAKWLFEKPPDCADIILTQYEDYARGELPPWKIKQLESNKGWRWMTLEECFEVRQKFIELQCIIMSNCKKHLNW